MAGFGMFSGILGIVFTVILVVNVALPTIHGANTTSWSTAEIAVYSLVGLGAVFGLAYGVLAAFGLVG
jgi:hypothetical protein